MHHAFFISAPTNLRRSAELSIENVYVPYVRVTHSLKYAVADRSPRVIRNDLDFNPELA
jgi:hypothetical protein